MLFYAARQPILDVNKELFAYELLFREGIDNVFPNIDGDEATSKIITGSQFAFSVEDFTGDKPAFINFTLETLQKKYPTLIPNHQVVVEVLETVQPGKRLLRECKELKEKGYTLALDDYEHQPVWKHFFPYIDIIKIDFQISSIDDIKQLITVLKPYPHIKLLAEKVETNEQFETAKSLGFAYFQGYFFSKPEIMHAKSLSPSQMTLAELLYETSKSEMDLQKITQVFERDINLSYKLLRYSNSAAFKRRTEISTIKQALIVLGSAELKKFLSVLFTAQVSNDKPAELMGMAMTRARFCEGLAELHNKIQDTPMAFLTGMMSLIDAILDEKMESVLEKLPLAQDIKNALINGEGLLADYLTLVKHYESADWDKANEKIAELTLPSQQIPNIYHDAVQWSNEQMKAMNEQS
ncbi:EAL and HDOD domain-containing protein [Flocculibacter collagenilyticus]|uniref:EAL and HDOD domain-containing protein n=1 Tax=Flocculibacter collagenilyticus TaxID=2744479 RepID=UPI0018F5A4D2|nr:HDOD domain-containing protein [Flocculibacter collagenilyticus]